MPCLTLAAAFYVGCKNRIGQHKGNLSKALRGKKNRTAQGESKQRPAWQEKTDLGQFEAFCHHIFRPDTCTSFL